jgi:hypothetical protein
MSGAAARRMRDRRAPTDRRAAWKDWLRPIIARAQAAGIGVDKFLERFPIRTQHQRIAKLFQEMKQTPRVPLTDLERLGAVIVRDRCTEWQLVLPLVTVRSLVIWLYRGAR